MQIKINNNEYIVKFTYRSIAKTDLLDRVTEVMSEENPTIRGLVELTGELFLAGLQKHHKDKFGYLTDSEKADRIDTVYDMMDDYDADADENHTAYTLLTSLIEELTSNGFLSGAVKQMSNLPQNHQKSAKAATSKK